MSRSIRLALVLFSLALTLTGSALACRTFRDQLDALETQAMLQHQRTVCGVESDFTAAYAAARAAASTDNFTAPCPHRRQLHPRPAAHPRRQHARLCTSA